MGTVIVDVITSVCKTQWCVNEMYIYAGAGNKGKKCVPAYSMSCSSPYLRIATFDT